MPSVSLRRHPLLAVAGTGEKSDVAAKHPDVVERLTEAVFAWNKTLPADAGGRK